MTTIVRRDVLRWGLAAAGATLAGPRLWGQDAKPGSFAEQLVLTPKQTEGPFYPVKLPLDTDNDLIIVNDGLTSAVGEITHLSGRVLDSKGDPIRNVLVEIWQVDNAGAYLHEKSSNGEKRDKNFQGFGRCTRGSPGESY